MDAPIEATRSSGRASPIAKPTTTMTARVAVTTHPTRLRRSALMPGDLGDRLHVSGRLPGPPPPQNRQAPHEPAHRHEPYEWEPPHSKPHALLVDALQRKVQVAVQGLVDCRR